jgi:hypothetical protein
MSFLLWQSAYEEGNCVVMAPENVDQIFDLEDGVSIADDYPADAYCGMDPDYPKDIRLTDNLHEGVHTIISKRLKEAMEKERVNHVEFLPLRIVNHKGRTASKDYFLMNPLDLCDCIDLDKSGVKWNKLAKDRIATCEKLVLRESAVPKKYLIFRPKFWTNRILVRSELADRLTSGGFTGLVFREPETYEGLG